MILLLVSISTVALIQLKNENSFTDVLYTHDWSHLPGGTVVDDGIQITALNQNIIHQDGSKAQLNPTVNVYGPHLNVTGNFEVKATMQDMEDGASLQLYGQVPVIYDEWRQERPSIRIDVSSETVEARIWDGNSSTSMDIRSYNVDLQDEITLNIKRVDGMITIVVDGKTLGAMPDHNIFIDETVWFGADGSDKGDGWLLRGLEARPIGDGQLEVVGAPNLVVKRDDPNLLRNLADRLPRKVKIGVAVSVYPLFTDKQYQNIAMSEFNLVTLESSLKAQFIHPAPDKYNFTDADNIIAMAQTNDQAIHGHTLVFAKSNPSWMTDSPEAELPKIMTDHITNVVEHFKGRVESWDVVNEPLSEKDEDYTNGGAGLRQSFWEESMGESYIDRAFIAAKKADPDAELYLNDYGIEHSGQRWDALLALIKRLQSRGVPIDGVGFESHVYQETDEIDFKTLRAHIRELTKLGLSVRISEIDVSGTNVKFQNEQYSGVLSLCLSSSSCTSYTTWGITDLYGSTNVADRYPLKLGSSLLWDEGYRPKPALESLKVLLRASIIPN
jgi:endo-1,4-beta-xylanase